jgi:hypothetical protein
MWKDNTRVAVAASFWMAAIALMAFRTTGVASPALTGWAVLCALAGCMFTGWHLLVIERVRAETIAERAVALAIERGHLDSIR